jgi:hypothetical protein
MFCEHLFYMVSTIGNSPSGRLVFHFVDVHTYRIWQILLVRPGADPIVAEWGSAPTQIFKFLNYLCIFEGIFFRFCKFVQRMPPVN